MRESCITINCGCCGNGGTTQPPGAESGVPVGTIISYMGTKAPEHYLICDGKVLNIADYPYLSQQIQDEFEMMDYFGGDGTTTFAVPDLRGEFLRGTGTAIRDSGCGGVVGGHQDGTEQISIYKSNTPRIGVELNSATNAYTKNYDKVIMPANGFHSVAADQSADSIRDNVNSIGTYTSRPTNTAVLWCIKFE